MSRSTIVYLVMIVVLVGGLWAVLAIGSRLDAPEDLAGNWTIKTAGGPVKFTVEQSGRYFQITFDGRPGIDLRRDGPTDGPTRLVGEKWAMDFKPGGSADDRLVHVEGPLNLDGPAHRDHRRYPVEGPAK